MKSALATTMAVLSGAANHPTLPTRWTATVREFGLGVVHESEHFVFKSDDKNVSAKWTNFTDGSCQRLLHAGVEYMQQAFLLKCDAVDCCYEDHSTPIEYQIPNVHPNWLAPVTHMGKVNVTLFDGNTFETDHWTWKFAIENFSAYTTTAADGSTSLRKWQVDTEGMQYPNEYADYKIIPAEQEESWLATFAIPDQCKGGEVMTCADAYKKGKLSEKSMKLLRHGRHHKAPADVVV